MKKCYIAKKWELASAPGNYRYSLLQYNPIQNACYPTGKYCMTAGQLLSLIDCPEVEQWRYVTQITICGYTVTSYLYPGNDTNNEAQMLVIEYHSIYGTKAVKNAEECGLEAKTESGGSSMEGKRFAFDVNSEEFWEIYNILRDVQRTLEEKKIGTDAYTEKQECQSHRYEMVSMLVARMRSSMDDWLLHNQIHPYTKWRMAQLRCHAEEMICLFDLEEHKNGKNSGK